MWCSLMSSFTRSKQDYLTKISLLIIWKHKPEKLEVILTGQNPSQNLMDLADYVSEIRKVKHPYDRGFAPEKELKNRVYNQLQTLTAIKRGGQPVKNPADGGILFKLLNAYSHDTA